ncbi:hypothetical protein Tco_1176337 [Tanacetum coccineum]
MKHGLNFTSAGAGIIFSSGSELGQHISFIQQIQQVMDTFKRFTLTMGETKAADLISDSVFYISIGTNNYIHYYLLDVSGVQSKYVSWNFTRNGVWECFKSSMAHAASEVLDFSKNYTLEHLNTYLDGLVGKLHVLLQIGMQWKLKESVKSQKQLRIEGSLFRQRRQPFKKFYVVFE